MKILIVYYSFTRNNELLANEIQRRTGGDLYRIEEVRGRTGCTIMNDMIFNRFPRIKPCTADLEKYDYFIFIAPVWSGKIATPLKTFFREHRHQIHRYSFITLCGGIAGQKESITEALHIHLQDPPQCVVELWINQLLTKRKIGKVKRPTGYHVKQEDFGFFKPAIDEFLEVIYGGVLA